MKTIINRMRWLYAGVLLGMWAYAYIMLSDAEKQKIKADNDKKFNDIVNHYKETHNA